MVNYIRPIGLLSIIGTLMACGGSSTGGFQPGTTTVSGFDELVALSEAYEDRFYGAGPNSSEHRIATAAEVPAAGAASFTGYLTIGPPRLAPFMYDRFSAAAKTTVDVDFDTGNVTSETGRFYNTTDRFDPTGNYGARVGGSVDYTMERFPGGTDPLFVGEISGSLYTSDGTEIPINEFITGAVMGPEADGFRIISTEDLGMDVQVSALRD